MKNIVIAALLSAAIFMTMPNSSTPVNNSEPKAAATKPAKQPRQMSAEHIAQEVKQVETPAPQTPAAQPEQVQSTCQSEIAKYDWSQDVALAVATAESGLDPGIVNNTPATGDYSIGCFQVNIYGSLATTRPSEAELKDPHTNVKWAYGHYVANGNSFIGKWGVCRAKVDCY